MFFEVLRCIGNAIEKHEAYEESTFKGPILQRIVELSIKTDSPLPGTGWRFTLLNSRMFAHTQSLLNHQVWHLLPYEYNNTSVHYARSQYTGWCKSDRNIRSLIIIYLAWWICTICVTHICKHFKTISIKHFVWYCFPL